MKLRSIVALTLGLMTAAGVNPAQAQAPELCDPAGPTSDGTACDMVSPAGGDIGHNSVVLHWPGVDAFVSWCETSTSEASCEGEKSVTPNFVSSGVTLPVSGSTGQLLVPGFTEGNTLHFRLIVVGPPRLLGPVQAYGPIPAVPDPAPVVQPIVVTPTTPDEGQRVTMTAMATDEDAAGDPFTNLAYLWTQTDSATVTTAATTNVVVLDGATTAVASFATLEAQISITRYFRLVVTGSGGAMTAIRQTVTVTGDNDAPTVTATPSTTAATPGTLVTLTATANDVDNANSAIMYAWTCTPTFDAAATLTAADITLLPTAAATPSETNAQVTFTAPALTAADDAAKTAAMIAIACEVTATSGGADVTATATVVVSSPAGATVDNTVLPEVLRNTTHGIHRGIYERILERQRRDGKWH